MATASATAAVRTARPVTTKLSAALCRALLACALVFAPAAAHSTGEQTYTVGEFRDIDRAYVSSALQRVNDLTARHMGARLTGAATDLDYLQRLLDQNRVAHDDIQTLQAMGVAFAEVLRKQRYLKWVLYSDREGTSRALQLAHENYFIYPITAISRRASVGAEVDMQRLLHRNIAALDAYVESQRYQ